MRQITCGFETGSIDEAGLSTGVTASIVTTVGVRSGNYCLYLASDSNWGHVWPITGAPNELYFCHGIVFTSYPGINASWLRLTEGTTTHIALNISISGILTVLRGTTTIVTSAYIFPLGGGSRWLKGHVKIADDPDGIVEIWIDGIKVVDFTGDTRNAATGVIDGFRLYHENNSMRHYFDDLKVNDTTGDYENGMPGDGGILLLKPNGAGATTQLTPSAGDNYACVDEVPPSTADYVSSSTPDQLDTYTLEDIPAPYNAVKLVQPISYAALAVAGTGAVRNVLRSGGTDYIDGADKPCDVAYAYKLGDIRYVDPADSQPWTPAKVNSLEAGVQVK